jgi:hypothetical protein
MATHLTKWHVLAILGGPILFTWALVRMAGPQDTGPSVFASMSSDRSAKVQQALQRAAEGHDKGVSARGESAVTDTPGDKVAAYTFAQDFVKDRLKSPSTASFPWGMKDATLYLGRNGYRIRSYVDSQNGFGATVRTDFDCTVRQNGDKWTLERMEMREH